ncbi:MAG: hypothetical protein COB66_02920 [Coxiella sp. (in: Bacteria)]|nr:MAG: hypothetical protein COB66_02920 [Coxiella sp. (in: g-proteobacteria)]
MYKKLLQLGLFVITSSLLSGCFHKPVDPSDPYENFNRSMFAFNMDMDHLFMRPIAQTYNFLLPHFAQTGVKNAFDNLDEVTSIPNDVLQGKFLFMLNDFWRLLINSTVGVGGLFDVAKHMGLRPHYESFELTLAYWQGNTHTSPYLVLPFMGPGTFRSNFGGVIDLPTTPYFYIPGKYWYIDAAARGLQITNHRSELLPANRMIDTAFDPYVFVRSAYTQTMDKRLKENLAETFKSKHIVSSNRLTVQDFKNVSDADNATELDSKGISLEQAKDSGFIFANEPAAKDTATKKGGTTKLADPAATKTPPKSKEEKK